MSDPLALRVATYKILADYARDRYNDSRAEMAARMANGDRLMAESDDGRKLGAVSKRDAKPVARVADLPALHDWIATRYPERMVEDLQVIASQEEITSVLLKHAPSMVRQISRPDPDFVRSILDTSVKNRVAVGPGGEADLPGVTVDVVEGAVSCLPAEGALGVVVDMLQAGTLDLLDVLPVGAA